MCCLAGGLKHCFCLGLLTCSDFAKSLSQGQLSLDLLGDPARFLSQGTGLTLVEEQVPEGSGEGLGHPAPSLQGPSATLSAEGEAGPCPARTAQGKC